MTESSSSTIPPPPPPPPPPPSSKAFDYSLETTIDSNLSKSNDQKENNKNKFISHNQFNKDKLSKLLETKQQISYFKNNLNHANINYGYDSTINSQYSIDTSSYAIYKAPKLPNNIKKNNIKKSNSTQQNLNYFDPNSLEVINGKIQNKSNLIRESSQLLPQSIEKQMAKNLQSLKFTSNIANSASCLDNCNQISKYTEGTSLPAGNEQQLRDEDAWLPILNLVQEQVIFLLFFFIIKHQNFMIFLFQDIKI